MAKSKRDSFSKRDRKQVTREDQRIARGMKRMRDHWEDDGEYSEDL